jgi:hypothetical protein
MPDEVMRDGCLLCSPAPPPSRYMELEQHSPEGLLAGVLAAGQLAAFSPATAKSVTDAGLATPLVQCLLHADTAVVGAAAWACEKIASHGAASNMALVHAGALVHILDRFQQSQQAGGGEDGAAGAAIPATCSSRLSPSAGGAAAVGLSSGGRGPARGGTPGRVAGCAPQAAVMRGGAVVRASWGENQPKLKAALKAVIRNCSSAEALQGMVGGGVPPVVLRHVLAALVPLLAASPKVRQAFVVCGALERVQQIAAVVGGDERTPGLARQINQLFPADVVEYYGGCAAAAIADGDKGAAVAQ